MVVPVVAAAAAMVAVVAVAAAATAVVVAAAAGWQTRSGWPPPENVLQSRRVMLVANGDDELSHPLMVGVRVVVGEWQCTLIPSSASYNFEILEG
jgi:hypothetical protein